MYYKINEEGTGLLYSKTVKAGYKPLQSELPPENTDRNKKLVKKFTETSTHIISGWDVVEKTVIEKIADLEMRQTPRLMREAALGQEWAMIELDDIDGEIAILREHL